MAFLRLSLSQNRILAAASHCVKAHRTPGQVMANLRPVLCVCRASEMNNRFRDRKGRKSMQEHLANLEEAMQKEREPVGEHFLGYGFRSGKDRHSMLTLSKSFLLNYRLHDSTCLYVFFFFFRILK